MNVLILNGSPRKHGNIARMLSAIESRGRIIRRKCDSFMHFRLTGQAMHRMHGMP